MKRFKVLVVDDSAFMRKIISDMITEDDEFEVIGTAKNGAEAVDKAKEWKPDVITLDVEMPVMNGLQALKAIMSTVPTPVIMLSSLTDEGARETIAALEIGAIDFIRKPSGSISLDLYKVREQLLDKLRTAVKAKVRMNSAAEPLAASTKVLSGKSSDTWNSELSLFAPFEAVIDKVLAIGTSTGGPKALQAVLGAIPALFPAPVLIVQHMPPNFTKSLAERLNSTCDIRVVEAQHNMAVIAGTAYIAPGGLHMMLKRTDQGGFRIHLTNDEQRSGHRPSVDVLFESLVPFKEIKRYAVIMTGMGADGAKGIKELKNSGAVATIAESDETCIVYGMPRSAVELQAIDHVLKLQDIPKKLIEIIIRQP